MGRGKNNAGDKGGGLDFEDFQLWKAFTRDIEPLEDPAWDVVEDSVTPAKPQERVTVKNTPPLQPTPQRTAPAQAPQLDGRTDSRLRRGRLPIEGRIDLHGYNQIQARDVLQDFIMAAHARGKRCVLVITGKGRVDEDGMREGVIRQKFPQWMREPPVGPLVLKYYPAQQKDGGSGAWYVYLRRARELSI